MANTDKYEIYWRDRNRNFSGRIDRFFRFNATMNYNDVGSWRLEFDLESDDATIPNWGEGIVLKRNDVPVLSGPLKMVREIFNSKTRILRLVGRTDEAYLAHKRCYVEVGAAPADWVTAYDTRTGPAETVAKQLVDLNAGPNALAGRPVRGLTVAATNALGATVTSQRRLDMLLEALQEVCEEGGIGFRMVNMEFDTYVPVDKSASIIFSTELGNMIDYNYMIELPKANYIIAGGAGELAARDFTSVDDGDSINEFDERIEYFYDYGNAGSVADLRAKATAKLATLSSAYSLVAQVKEVTHMKFFDDFFLGDIVSANVRGTVFDNIIRSAHINLNPKKGVVVRPFISPRSLSPLMLFNYEKIMNARVDKLERR